MANAKPTFTATINNRGRRVKRPLDPLGSLPAVCYDPRIMRIGSVFLHTEGGQATVMTRKKAINKKLIEIVLYGGKVYVFLKSHRVQINLEPTDNLLKMMSAAPKTFI